MAMLVASPAIFSLPAHAQDSAQIGGFAGWSTTVTIQPSEAPGAVAEIVFDNRNVNGPSDDGVYTIRLGEIVADVTFTWTNGADSIAVTVPEGFIAVPETLTMAEDSGTGVILIFSGEDVGM